MADHYYTATPHSQSNQQTIEVKLVGLDLHFTTDNGVFSKQRMDFGSHLLVETFAQEVQLAESILDLGAGYGAMTIALAKLYPQAHLVGVELNERALNLAQTNQDLNRVESISWLQADATNINLDVMFDFVITNPPIRAGKAVIQAFVDQAYKYLNPCGQVWVVIQKKQGAPSMMDYLQASFGNVTKLKQDKGYWILVSTKESV